MRNLLEGVQDLREPVQAASGHEGRRAALDKTQQHCGCESHVAKLEVSGAGYGGQREAGPHNHDTCKVLDIQATQLHARQT
jgi:hypothetical protein